MICRTKEIEIPKNFPFENCKLKREPYASILTKVVSRLEDGGVLSICGEWGSGKTTFVKMWEQQLKNEGFQTLYFNVWEHDFMSDPLIGIITQFRRLVPNEEAKQKLATISNAFISIVTGVMPKIVKSIASNYIGEETAEILEAGVEKATDSFESILDDFDKQSHSIIEFRECLSNYVQSISCGKPIIFIVDELDRCNPHYAVKSLERIKHLFNIPGIIFVLSVDKTQLCNSIRGYFGSEQLNAEEYLKRFIDFEYQLPKSDISSYCQYLYEQYGFKQFFDSKNRQQFFKNTDETSEFLKMTEILITNMNLNLRQIEKQFTHLRIVLLSFNANEIVFPSIIVLLEFFRQNHPNFYQKMYNKQYNIDEFVEKLEEYLPQKLLSPINEYDHESRIFIFNVAKLICCYTYYPSNSKCFDNLISNNDNPKLLFNCKVIDKEILFSAIQFELRNIYKGFTNITILIDHLELLKDLKEL